MFDRTLIYAPRTIEIQCGYFFNMLQMVKRLNPGILKIFLPLSVKPRRP